MGSLHGFMYKYLKNMVLSLFGPESLKKMLPEVEETVLKQMNQWTKLDSVEIKDATASVSLLNFCSVANIWSKAPLEVRTIY